MKLSDSVLRNFHVAKVFRENSDKINSFDFSLNGETVISSSDDDSIVLCDCQEGKPKRTLYRWQDPCLEWREWYKSSDAGWQTHRPHHLSAGQPQVHDFCQCLFQHGLLVTHHR
uniref:Uncharacterized protein n=1 Tax=Balaenoptera musculus TaxID=9771 RepID=A0A8C0D896_BALMU